MSANSFSLEESKNCRLGKSKTGIFGKDTLGCDHIELYHSGIRCTFMQETRIV